jgi:hypothetical protein
MIKGKVFRKVSDATLEAPIRSVGVKVQGPPAAQYEYKSLGVESQTRARRTAQEVL